LILHHRSPIHQRWHKLNAWASSPPSLASSIVLDPLKLHELATMPIFENDYVPHHVDFLQDLVHDLCLLEELGVHFFFFIT